VHGSEEGGEWKQKNEVPGQSSGPLPWLRQRASLGRSRVRASILDMAHAVLER
jgi:hypothetical protein